MQVKISIESKSTDGEVLKEGVEVILKHMYYKHHDPDLLITCKRDNRKLYHMLNKFTCKYNIPFKIEDGGSCKADKNYSAIILRGNVRLKDDDGGTSRQLKFLS